MAVVLTIGTNSWATVAQADAYFNSKYGTSEWAPLVDDDKKRLLISAFNWIRQQTMFDIALTDTSEVVRQAQCESAWFIFKYFEDYQEHRALAASGVKAFRALDASESLGAVVFPDFIATILLEFNSAARENFPRAHRDLSENSTR